MTRLQHQIGRPTCIGLVAALAVFVALLGAAFADRSGTPFDINMPLALVASADDGGIADLSVPLAVQALAPDSNRLAATSYERGLMSSPRPPFTIVALPDTQFYSKTYPATFTAQTQWIVDNRDSLNIAYVGHEGDIVDSAFQATQWQRANTSLSVFDNVPDLPFGLCIGNHDEYPQDNPNGTAEFNTWFPYTRYASRPWYGGHQGTTNDSHYILFTAGGMDFVAIHIKYDKTGSPATLAWVGNVLQTHFDRRGILVAHSLLEPDATWTTQGAIVYNALRGYPNLFLMLCGHEHGEARRTDVYNGWTVHTLLADYQLRDLGGDGWLRILQFVPDDNQIIVRTYSPTRGQYEQDADSQFNLAYDMTPTGMPCIQLEPASLTPVVPERQDAADDSFVVSNPCLGTLHYAITDDATWLSQTPTAGSLGSGQAQTITVQYATANLTPGMYHATITVADGNANNSPQTVAVTLTINKVFAVADFDSDGDVDLTDFSLFQVCFGGPNRSPGLNCPVNADFDSDGDVDLIDFARFQACFNGPNRPSACLRT